MQKGSFFCCKKCYGIEIDFPASFLICGPSCCQKTHWVFRFIENRNEIFTEKIERILYFSDTYQKKFDEYLNKIEFIQETLTLEILKLADRCLLVLDDLMHYPQDLITKIFTVDAHHFNFSVIFTAQNLFNKNIHKILLNSHFVVLFKNCPNATQIQHFLRQAFPHKTKAVYEAYKNAVATPRGYLMLDFRPDTEDSQRIRTNVFPNEVNYIYQ